MPYGTDDGSTNGNNDAGNNTTNVENTSNVGEGSFGSAFDKHLDIAIEAQDGAKAKTDTSKEGSEAGTQDSESGQSKDSTSSTGDNNTQAKPSLDASEAGRALARAKDLKINEDGQELVVRGGTERRFYEQRNLAREQAATLKRQFEERDTAYKTLEQQHNELKSTVQSIQGADPDAVRIGVQMVNDLQRDPVGTMKKLLAEVTAQGYKIEDIGAGVDTAAIQRMIDERLPKQEQQGQTDAQIEADTIKEVTTFYSQHPDARTHDALLAQVMRDHPALDLQGAYFQLKSAFIDKGFDWSQTLEENLKGVSGHNNSEANSQNNNQQTDNTKPLPNGRASDVGEFKLDNGNGVAHEDTDTSEIVRAAMREAGMNI